MSKTYGKSDELIKSKVGETFSIELESLFPYEWEGSFDEKSVKLVDKRSEPPGSDAIGGSGKEIFTFKPVDEGSSTLRLKYKRPWDQESAETVEIKVQAKK